MSFWEICPTIWDRIAQRPLREEEAVIHLGNSFSGRLLWGPAAAGVGVADALINGSEGFLVFILIDGGRIVEVNSTDFSHSLTVARICR